MELVGGPDGDSAAEQTSSYARSGVNAGGSPSQSAPAIALIALILVVTTLLAAYSAWREHGYTESRRQSLDERGGAALELVLASTLSSLRSFEAVVGEDGEPSQRDFGRFARSLDAGGQIVAMAFARVIPGGDRVAYEEAMGMTVTQLADGGFVAAAEAEVFVPVEHMYPLDESTEAVLGFDLISDPVRGGSVRQAVETGELIVTAPIALAATGQSALAAFQPIDLGTGETGVVAAAVATEDLADSVQAFLPREMVVTVATQAGEILDTSDGRQSAIGPGRGAPVEVGGSTFLVHASDGAAMSWGAPAVVFVGGLALAGGLSLFFYLSSRNQARVARAERRAEALLEVTSTLSQAVTSRDVAIALVSPARSLVEASGCVVGVMSADGRTLRLEATDGLEPERSEHVEGLPVGAGTALDRAVELRRPLWRARGGSWSEPDLYSPFADAARSALAIPLVVDGRSSSGGTVVGVVGFTFDDEDFTPAQRSMAEALCAQAAQAMERARQYDREHDIASSLQRRLLPPTIPDAEGFAVAAAYSAGAPGTVVGGDWYDVMVDLPGHVLVVVGDVVGSGAPAAATMGQLRAALEISARELLDPVSMLTALDSFAERHDDALGSTCCIVDVRVDGTVVHARAGHPPPLVVGPDGPRFLEEGVAPPLGVGRREGHGAASAMLGTGETLVLFTDGAVERRGEALDVGLRRFAARAQARASADATAMCEELLADLLAGGQQTDDIALVVVKRSPVSLT